MNKKIVQSILTALAILVLTAGGYSQDGQPVDHYEAAAPRDTIDFVVEDASSSSFGEEVLDNPVINDNAEVEGPDIFDEEFIEEEEVDDSSNSIISFNILYYLLQKFKFNNYFN